MPVMSTRRYSSSSYLSPSTTISSSVGSYRPSYSSDHTSSSTKNYLSTNSRYTTSTSSSYRSSRSDDFDKNKTPTNSLSTRGVSKTHARSDTLPPLPPTAFSSLSLSDMDFYEKYSPSRYSTKFELSRARSLSDSTQITTRDKKSPSSTKSISNESPSYTSKYEVWALGLSSVPNLKSKAFTFEYCFLTNYNN